SSRRTSFSILRRSPILIFPVAHERQGTELGGNRTSSVSIYRSNAIAGLSWLRRGRYDERRSCHIGRAALVWAGVCMGALGRSTSRLQDKRLPWAGTKERFSAFHRTPLQLLR